ncbi:hypothetical protein [Sphingorhabdus sp.]|jgi:hypothetical protein|uniref:hypothetical protein n=1 Tax=Sphingorhabdus sp. TaxID=1902408 RepID=UPI0037C879EA
MTTEQQVRSDAKTRKFTRTALQMIVGGAFGFFSVLGVDRLVSVGNMSAAGIVALGLALFFGLVGVIVFAMATNRKVFMAVQPEAEDDDGADFEQMRSLLFWSAICAFLYAAILVLMALASINDVGPQLMSFWSICALMLAQTAISVMLWTKYDELYRDIMKDSSAATFAIVEFGLIIWAAATICGFDVAFDPLTVIVAITGVNLASQFWFCLRRGLT